MSLNEMYTRANIQAIIALIIVIGGLLFLAFIDATEGIKATVGNFIMLVLGYYFGSSNSSSKKTDIIAQNGK